MPNFPIIDTHLHIWDFDRLDYREKCVFLGEIKLRNILPANQNIASFDDDIPEFIRKFDEKESN